MFILSAGKIIKFLRIKHGLTQDEMANILSVKKSSIQKYEADNVPNLKIDTIRILSNYFGITPTAFIFPENYRNIDLKLLINNKNQIDELNKLLLLNLNESGRKKVFEYARDLNDSKNYRELQ